MAITVCKHKIVDKKSRKKIQKNFSKKKKKESKKTFFSDFFFFKKSWDIIMKYVAGITNCEITKCESLVQ